MHVLVTGGTGALGRRLVPRLAREGWTVTATARSASKARGVAAPGVEGVVVDLLDRSAVVRLVADTRPDVIVHEATALAGALNLRRFDRTFELTNRLRAETTAYLVEAARAHGTRQLVAQSFAGWPYARVGGPVKSEDDPLDTNPPAPMRRTLAAIQALERLVTSAPDLRGVVLRYGGFYGPGTSIATDGTVVDFVRRRRLPVIGSGRGLTSFIHVDDAAAATVAAIRHAEPGIYNIVDDEPASMADWVTELAAVVGAPAPLHVPAWIGRLAAGEAGLLMATSARGASNAKARRVLGWRPVCASWRDGFRRGLGEAIETMADRHTARPSAWSGVAGR